MELWRDSFKLERIYGGMIFPRPLDADNFWSFPSPELVLWIVEPEPGPAPIDELKRHVSNMQAMVAVYKHPAGGPKRGGAR